LANQAATTTDATSASDATGPNPANTTTTTTAAHAGPASAPANDDEQEPQEGDPYHNHPANVPTMRFKLVPIHKPKPNVLPAATNATISNPAPITNPTPPITTTTPADDAPSTATATATASSIVNGTPRNTAPPTGGILKMPPRQSPLAMQYGLMPPPAPPTAPAPAVPAPAKRGRKPKVIPPEVDKEFTPVEETAAKKTRGKRPVKSQEPTSDPTDAPVPTSTDTTDPLPNNPVAAAPGRATRKKRTAESAGIVEPEASVATRKSQRRA
jgi:hypothetical protein